MNMWTGKDNPRLPVQNMIFPPPPPLNDMHFSVESSKKRKSISTNYQGLNCETPHNFGFPRDPMLHRNSDSQALESSKDQLYRYNTDFGSSVSTNNQGPNSGIPYNIGDPMLQPISDSRDLASSRDQLYRHSTFGSSISTNYQGSNSGTPYNSGFSRDPMLPRNSDSQSLQSSNDQLYMHSDFGSSVSTNYQGPNSGTLYNSGFSRDSMLPRNSDSQDLKLARDQLYMHSDFGSSVSTNYQGPSSGTPYNSGFSSGLVLPCNSDSQALESAKDQLYMHNTDFGTWQTSNGCFRDGAVDRTRKVSPMVISQYSHERGHFPLSNLQPQEHFTFSKTEAHTPLNHQQSFTAITENVASNSINFGNSNRGPKINFPFDGFKLTSDTSEILSDMKKSGVGFNDISNVGGAPFGNTACTEHNEGRRLLKSGNALSDVSRDDNFQDNDKGRVDENIDILKKKVKVDLQNMKQSSVQGGSPMHGHSPAKSIDKSFQSDDQTLNSLKSDESSILLPGKEDPISTKKLWDGSIQLSTTVTMSALAFFKSGEKMPDVKWSESVEVKGKVRLESFEKYIQDLPRSCNRGLMVISLRWKKGSPKIGLEGMKEVAEKYEKGNKVGYTLLSPGVDLYICPRSDTIFTILAKYGYLKGMAAAEDNQDSLLGCVVWRRNKISPSSVEKITDMKNQSVSEPLLHSPSKQEVQKSILNVPTTDFAPLGNEGKNIIESKSIESSKNQLQADETNNSSVISSVQRNTVVISSVQGNTIEPPVTKFSDFENIKSSLELWKPAKLLIHSEDDDDLPEFDFNRASSRPSLAPLSMCANAVTFNLNQSVPVSDIPFLSVSESNYVSQSNPPKNRFDDDDMPEWCPPNLHFQIPSLPQSVRPSLTPITYNAPNSESVRPSITPMSTVGLPYGPNSVSVRPSITPMSNFESLSHSPQKSLQRFPTPGAAHSLYCFQDFRPEYSYPTTITAKPEGVQRDPNISRGFNPAPVLRPPPHSTFDISWKGWKP